MRSWVWSLALAGALFMAMVGQASATEFYAYYTKLDYSQPPLPDWLSYIPINAANVFSGGRPDPADAVVRPPSPGLIRWGKYADLVVNLGQGRELVFSRATGYLPYFQTAKGRYSFKPLVDGREDPLCLCSYVRLIEESPKKIVIHWRHVPDPASVVMTEVVHEYFIITPDGRVVREVRIGTERLDDFNNPANVTVEELFLSPEGIVEISLTKPKPLRSLKPAIARAPIRMSNAGRPKAWFRFDEGRGDDTFEAIGGTHCRVSGHKTLWKKGVSGTALAFDGYFSKVTLPKDKAPLIKDELTLEAWVVLGAYPWNDAGIIHQSSGEPISPIDYKHGYRDPYIYQPWKMKGYFLGVDPYGRPIFKVNGNQVGGGILGDKETIRREDMLPTYQWVHLTGTYGKGKMCLYVDGRLVASKPAHGPINVPDRDVLIGLNGDPQRVSDPVSHSKFAANNNLPFIYGIEGLIDEVKIYDRSLSAEEIWKSFLSFRPTEVAQPDLEKRLLPGEVTGAPAEKFGATYKTLKYHEFWDNLWRPSKYRDIVVRFDRVPCSVVFWQGTNFGSAWVTENNKWMSDQSWEIGGPHGCAEHMSDKRGRFAHIRLIENSPARVVVHWRYAAIDVGYVFPGTDIWADEYYTIYPDGVGVRFVDVPDEGWHDIQFLSQPGMTCLDDVDLTALSVANLRGESADLTWAPPNNVPANPIKDACIKRINFRSKYKVFVIYKEGAEIETWGALERSKHLPLEPFAGPWNHWPVGLAPSDGRYAVAHDRVTHAALGGANKIGNSVLYGFTDQGVTSLMVLAKSWNYPPAISKTVGCESRGYDQTQRAFVLMATNLPMSFELLGSEKSPIYNPCFVIEHWDSDSAARVMINGQPVSPGPNFRQGIVRDTQGRQTMVIWLELKSFSNTRVRVELAKS